MVIRTLVLTACAATCGLWMWGPAKDSTVDPIVSSSVRAPGRQDITVSNMESGAACLIFRGMPVSARSREIRPGKDCKDVWPGLTAAQNWTQNDDGTVVLTNASGEAILTLGLGDGVDFESLEPENAVLAFNMLN